MILRITLVASLCIANLLAHGQMPDVTGNLEVDAKRMIRAIESEDYATYVDLSYPAYIEAFGGKDLMVKMTKTNKDATKESGLILTSAKFKSSSPPLADSTSIQSIVTFEYLLDITGNAYVGENYLLAISTDEGNSWSFVELETFDEESIKTFVDVYNDQLTFPTISGAVLVKDLIKD